MTADLRFSSSIRNIVANMGNMKANAFNVNPAFRRKYQRRLAKAWVGQGRLKIACLGNSQTSGAGAGTGTSKLTGAKAKAYPAQLAKLFRNAGFIVSEDNSLGDNRVFDAGTAAVTLYDPKLTFAGSAWGRQAWGPAGQQFFNNTTADILTYTPAVAGEFIDVYYSKFGGASSFTISDAGSQIGSAIVAAGGNAFVKASVTRTASANPINIAKTPGGGGIYVAGVDQWAANTQISIYNQGAYGTLSADWANGNNPFDPLNAQTAIGADLILYQMGANDVRDAIPIATFKANMQAAITKWLGNGSNMILVVPFPDGNTLNDARWPSFIQALYELAFDNSLPLVDLYARFISYTASVEEYADSVHLLEEGYADMAMAIWELLRPQ